MKLYPSIDPNLAEWAARQPVFFTASAPTHLPHINVSPKGLSAHFAVLSPNLVAYIDRTGSGCETIAHSYENGRLTLMFMSFGPAPRILRLFCRSRIIEWDDPEFDSWMKRIVPPGEAGRDSYDGARAVVVGEVWEVQTSCGFGVPMIRKELYAAPAAAASSFEDGSLEKGNGHARRAVTQEGHDENDLVHHQNRKEEEEGEQQPARDELSVFEERPTLDTYWRKRADDNTVANYQRDNNRASIDGLPGLKAARRDAGEVLWASEARARAARAVRERDGLVLGFLLALVFCGLLRLW